VLINGAAGGVGTFAVQIARSYGAEVTGVCSTRNVDMVRSIGAEHVVDYTEEDFTRTGQRYDLVLDAVGNRSLSAYRRALTREAALVLVGAAPGRWIAPLAPFLKAFFATPFSAHPIRTFLAKRSQSDLVILKELIESAKVTPIVDRTYGLDEVPEAIRYLEEGHARGKVAITI
jgi:NADPH:quinone reductase-like Zn-dependent oxidoreductase